METVTLSRLVKEFAPEWREVLSKDELDSLIVLRDGVSALEPEDVLEIVQHSICEHQHNKLLN
ncbi:hypothetical protein ACFQWB_15615 [Paenibacillus thermoaerophilus]|uniref:Uncharacterized protein n=1 Tax=Paenibacillus thermoaerophilus TaxID=1215385 RepID=A0ABW2V5D3_9BACL|nr:hypothetical protein [Paenibacillus thermoaerophilus]TMV17853.1 hypothetical protein FE781_05185 [Paenibacillus thermoaerophilus]